MAASVWQIFEQIDGFAPFALAEPYDNVGLLCGRADASVGRVLVALDLLPDVIEEAVERDAQLIVTHHPILFHPRKNLREDDAEGALLCALVRSGCALIAAHTNYDKVQGGVNDALLRALGLTDARACEGGLCLVAPFSGTPHSLLALSRECLNPGARLYTPRDLTHIDTLGLCAGAGGEYFVQALEMGAQAFLTGEIRHHEILLALQQGMCVIDAGHYETERFLVKALVSGLQNALDALQYNVHVFESRIVPFG